MAEAAERVGHQGVPRGARLRLVIQLRDSSVPKLSKATGISEAQIYRYLRLELPGGGKAADPSGENLRAISEALDVHPGYLIGAYHWPDRLSAKGTRLTRQRSPRQKPTSQRPVQGSILVSAVR